MFLPRWLKRSGGQRSAHVEASVTNFETASDAAGPASAPPAASSLLVPKPSTSNGDGDAPPRSQQHNATTAARGSAPLAALCFRNSFDSVDESDIITVSRLGAMSNAAAFEPLSLSATKAGPQTDRNTPQNTTTSKSPPLKAALFHNRIATNTTEPLTGRSRMGTFPDKLASTIDPSAMIVESDSESVGPTSLIDGSPPKSATDSAFGVDEVERIDFISRLPFEIAVKVLEFVPDVRAASLVSRRWNLIATDNAIWRARYIRQFGLSRTQQQNPFVPRDWRSLIMQRMALLENWVDGTAEAAFINGHADSVYCIQHDAHKIVSGSRDRTIKFWDINTRECFRTFTGHNGSVLCLQYNDTYIVSGSSDCSVIVWDIATGKPLRKLVGHANPVLDVRFDEKIVVSCSKDCSIRVWNFATGELLRVLEGHRAAVNAIHLHGNLLASASGDCIVKLWDTATGKCIRDFVGHTRGLACVQFDGNIVVSGSNDRSIKIWNANTGDLLHTLKGHTDLVRTLCFDGDHLVSGSYDQTIKVWNIRTGELMLDLKDAHSSWVFHVQIDPSRIISASQDRKIAIWNFSNGENVDDFL